MASEASARQVYAACGLRLISSHALAGLLPDHPDAVVDTVPLEIFLDAEPPRAAAGPWTRVLDGSVLDDDGRPLLVIDRRADDPELLRFTYSDDTAFWLSADGRRVWGRRPAASPLENLLVYLTGPVLGLALRLRGCLPLHAGAVVIDGAAVVFAGPPQAGKSTTVAAFARAGHRILADDAAAIRPRADGGFEVAPDGCRLRLWPESSRLLFGRADALPPLAPEWSKGGLDLDPELVQRKPLPLRAIYLLDGEEDEHESAGARPSTPTESVARLAAHLAVPGFPDRAMGARELELLSKVVAAVPVRRFTRPRGERSVDELPSVVRADLDREPARV